MKKIAISLAVLFIAIACNKKKSDTYCYYEAMKGSTPIREWIVFRPSNDEIQKVQDSCRCTVTIKESCVPCNGTITDQGGIDIACY